MIEAAHVFLSHMYSTYSSLDAVNDGLRIIHATTRQEHRVLIYDLQPLPCSQRIVFQPQFKQLSEDPCSRSSLTLGPAKRNETAPKNERKKNSRILFCSRLGAGHLGSSQVNRRSDRSRAQAARAQPSASPLLLCFSSRPQATCEQSRKKTQQFEKVSEKK